MTILFISPLFAKLEPTTESIDKAVQGKKRDTQTKLALAKFLSDPGTPVLVKERAAWALGQLDIRSQNKALLKAGENKSLLVRSAALDSLIRLRASSALPLLKKTAAEDPVFSLRFKAIVGMGLLRQADAIATLVKLAQDSNEEIRGVTALAMAALQSKKNDFGDAMDYLGKDKSSFVQERAKIGKEIVNKNSSAVLNKLESADPVVRLFAAQYFHYHGKAGHISSLKNHLAAEINGDVKHELDLAVKGIQNRIREEEKRKAAAQKAKSAAPKK